MNAHATLQRPPSTTPVQTYLSKPHAPGMARLYTRARLTEWGTEPGSETARAAEQAVSELVANAVQHGGGPTVTLQLRRTPASVLISVGDASPDPPAPRAPGELAETGRGLHIVRALSASTGYYRTGHGKIVWSEIAA